MSVEQPWNDGELGLKWRAEIGIAAARIALREQEALVPRGIGGTTCSTPHKLSTRSDFPKAQTEDVFFALGSVASHVGEVAGVLLVLVQLLARDRLISMIDAKKLIGLLR